MKSKLAVVFFLSFVSFISVAQTIESGVAQELASSRKGQIRNIKYLLAFHIPGGNQSIAATENISFDLIDTTHPVLIDFKSNAKALKKLTVNGKSISPIYKNEHIIIEGSLLHKEKDQVKIDFISSGKPMKIDSGRLVYCLFVPARARESFPCFDQPDLKASFTLKLTVPPDWLAVSNAPIAASVKQHGETSWEFEATKPISTYLFTFATGKFKVDSTTRDHRTIHFYYLETQQRKIDSSLKRCMDLNFEALAFDSAYLQSQYPFQKFDFVAIPGFSVGGMEHPGAIFYKGTILFLDEASATDKYNRSLTIGHEVSHMWFGDLVTMKWFNEVWLKEVFADYIGDKFASVENPDRNFNKNFLLNNFPNAYAIDRFPSSDPIMRKLPNLNQAGLAYGAITYNKAPIMMHQLELLLGEINFKKGVQDYIHQYKGGNADFSQLVEEFKKYSTGNLDAWLDTWVQKPGRPLIYYHLDTSRDTIQHFILSQYGEYDSSLVWQQQFDIMLFYDSNNIETLKIEMKSPVQEIVEAEGKKIPRFILFNTSGEGYGVFPVDKAFIDHGLRMVPPETRAAAVINLYELMLRSRQAEYAGNFKPVEKPGPLEMLHLLCSLVSWEPDNQILGTELKFIGSIYWKLLKLDTRKKTSLMLEEALREAIKAQANSKNKTSIFRTYVHVAETPLVVASLFRYWDKRILPEGVKFGTNDWSELAKQLALRNYRAEEVLRRQLDSLTGYDDRKSFLFQMKALSAKVSERDSFFNSLLSYTGRKQESDVISALQYLHHPLFQATSRKYIKQSLRILPELLQTNDVFFAPGWVNATLEYYQDDEAAQIVKSYLSNPNANVPYLMLQKVRQSADWVFMASKVAE